MWRQCQNVNTLGQKNVVKTGFLSISYAWENPEKQELTLAKNRVIKLKGRKRPGKHFLITFQSLGEFFSEIHRAKRILVNFLEKKVRQEIKALPAYVVVELRSMLTDKGVLYKEF